MSEFDEAPPVAKTLVPVEKHIQHFDWTTHFYWCNSCLDACKLTGGISQSLCVDSSRHKLTLHQRPHLHLWTEARHLNRTRFMARLRETFAALFSPPLPVSVSESHCSNTNLCVVRVKAMVALYWRSNVHNIEVKTWKCRGQMWDRKGRKKFTITDQNKGTSPMFPLFPSCVFLKAAEKTSHDPPAHWFLMRSLVKEPFLKLRRKCSFVFFSNLVLKSMVQLIHVL